MNHQTKFFSALFGLSFMFACISHAKCIEATGAKTALDQSTSEKTIHSFVDAINKPDVNAAASCVIGGKPTKDLKEMWQEIAKVFGMKCSIGELKLKIQNDIATAEVETKMEISGTFISCREQLRLRRMGDTWKIAPDPTTDSYQLGRDAMLQDRVESLVYPEQAVRIFLAAKATAQRLVCFAHVEELATAALKFAHAHQGRFMLQADKMKVSLAPHVQSEEAFICQAPKSASFSYSFNRNLERINKDTIKNPSKTVLIYEGHGQRLSYRHRDRATKQPVAVVAFMDGSVRYITRKQANSLLWKP